MPEFTAGLEMSPPRLLQFIKIWVRLQVFGGRDVSKDLVVLLAARASRTENQDAIDGAIVNMLADPKEVDLLIHFLSNLEVMGVRPYGSPALMTAGRQACQSTSSKPVNMP